MTLNPEEVRDLRAKLGLTQVELAERMDVTRITVANWESGRSPCSGPAAKLLVSIAKRSGRRS